MNLSSICHKNSPRLNQTSPAKACQEMCVCFRRLWFNQLSPFTVSIKCQWGQIWPQKGPRQVVGPYGRTSEPARHVGDSSVCGELQGRSGIGARFIYQRVCQFTQWCGRFRRIPGTNPLDDCMSKCLWSIPLVQENLLHKTICFSNITVDAW